MCSLFPVFMRFSMLIGTLLCVTPVCAQQQEIDNPPVISSGGVVLANLVPTVASISPLSIASVFGTGFAEEYIISASLDAEGRVDTTLAGSCVEIAGVRAPILAITPVQANVQVPAQAPLGPVGVVVIRNCGTPEEVRSAVEMVMVRETTPGFFLYPPVAPGGFIAARFPSGRIVGINLTDTWGSSRPAKPGEIVTLFGTGWEPTEVALATGELAPGAASVLEGANPKVTFGGIPLAEDDILYVGVAPRYAGLYQLNIRVPLTAQPGNNEVVLTVYGESSPPGPVIPVVAP